MLLVSVTLLFHHLLKTIPNLPSICIFIFKLPVSPQLNTNFLCPVWRSRLGIIMHCHPSILSRDKHCTILFLYHFLAIVPHDIICSCLLLMYYSCLFILHRHDFIMRHVLFLFSFNLESNPDIWIWTGHKLVVWQIKFIINFILNFLRCSILITSTWSNIIHRNRSLNS